MQGIELSEDEIEPESDSGSDDLGKKIKNEFKEFSNAI